MLSVQTPEKARPFLEVKEKVETKLAQVLPDAGADIICCEDLTASPMLISPHISVDLEFIIPEV